MKYVLLTLLMVAAATAEPMKFTLARGGKLVAAQGEIAEDTTAQFEQFIKTNPGVQAVWLNSPGGSISGALSLGRSIRKSNLSTYVGGLYQDGKMTPGTVTDYAECDSACVWAFAGGVNRIFDPMGGGLAVHQFYFDKTSVTPASDNASSAQYGMTAIGLYLDEMGVGRRVLDYATMVGPELHALPAFAVKQMNLAAVYDGSKSSNAKNDDDPTTFNALLPLAQHGNTTAQDTLGTMYASGEGVPQDYKEAVRWYRLAADHGNADAQYNLGILFENGQGVPQDYKDAGKWYRLAADQGNAHAQAGLGVLYAAGEGVPQDYNEAGKWFRLAADQGNAVAQANLGLLFKKGYGVPQDYKEAVRWYRLAADQGDALAQASLGFLFEKGYGVPQEYKEAVRWYRLAADQGEAVAQNNLGVLYEKGRGVSQDYKEAVRWYRLAADQGTAGAQYNLGVMYENGEGVPQDYKEAGKWYRLAADQGNVDAQNKLLRTADLSSRAAQRLQK